MSTTNTISTTTTKTKKHAIMILPAITGFHLKKFNGYPHRPKLIDIHKTLSFAQRLSVILMARFMGTADKCLEQKVIMIIQVGLCRWIFIYIGQKTTVMTQVYLQLYEKNCEKHRWYSDDCELTTCKYGSKFYFPSQCFC